MDQVHHCLLRLVSHHSQLRLVSQWTLVIIMVHWKRLRKPPQTKPNQTKLKYKKTLLFGGGFVVWCNVLRCGVGGSHMRRQIQLSCESQSSNISRVPDQNGVSLLYIMLEIYHSGLEPLIYSNFPSFNWSLNTRDKIHCEGNPWVWYGWVITFEAAYLGNQISMDLKAKPRIPDTLSLFCAARNTSHLIWFALWWINSSAKFFLTHHFCYKAQSLFRFYLHDW